ncbi:hypothetical protein Q5752_003531 [Cryptotrichosporon argae]
MGTVDTSALTAKTPTTPPPPASAPDSSVHKIKLKRKHQLAKYLVRGTGESFCGPIPGTHEATLALIRAECPALAAQPGTIRLALRFTDPTALIRDVDFRVLPAVWPHAIGTVLPLIVVDAVAPSVEVAADSATAATQTEIVGGGQADAAKATRQLATMRAIEKAAAGAALFS